MYKHLKIYVNLQHLLQLVTASSLRTGIFNHPCNPTANPSFITKHLLITQQSSIDALQKELTFCPSYK